jgi:hypothetical protein
MTTYDTLLEEAPQQLQGLPLPSGEGSSSSSSRMRNGGPLFRVAWHRVVLDQVDVLQYQAAEARAASMLVARHGWCLMEPDTLQGVGSLSHCFRYGYANPHIPVAQLHTHQKLTVFASIMPHWSACRFLLRQHDADDFMRRLHDSRYDNEEYGFESLYGGDWGWGPRGF